MYTPKDLFAIALGHFICNVDEVLEDVWHNDEWADVVVCETYENEDINDICSMVWDFQMALQDVQNNAKKQ